MHPTTHDVSRREFVAGISSAVAASLLQSSATGAPAAKPPIVDTHMHVWSNDPERFPYAHPYVPDAVPQGVGTGDVLLEDMDANGQTHCILVQMIHHGWDNSYVAHCVRAHPGRLKAHGLIDPTDPRVADKLEFWISEHGLSGMRFSPIYYEGRDDWMTSTAHEAAWKKADELGAVFNFFISTSQLPKLETMIQRFPAVPVVIDHLAQIDLKAADPQPALRRLLALARYDNVWVKVSELTSVSRSGKYPFTDAFPYVEQVYDAFGPDHLLWGTGYPGAARAVYARPTLAQELALVRDTIPFFTPRDREKILGANAAKVWKLNT
jgi:predicted TIM-barrel fold metal-dependent hydrolase